MKKILLIIFSLLFISTASIGGGLLLSGCNSSYLEIDGGDVSDTTNNEGDGNDSEQADDEKLEDIDKPVDIDDKNDEVSSKGWAGFYTMSNYNGVNGLESTECGTIHCTADGVYQGYVIGSQIGELPVGVDIQLEAVANNGWMFAGWIAYDETYGMQPPQGWPQKFDFNEAIVNIRIDDYYTMNAWIFCAYFIPYTYTINVQVYYTTDFESFSINSSRSALVTSYNANGVKISKTITGSSATSNLAGSTVTVTNSSGNYLFTIMTTPPTASNIFSYGLKSSYSTSSRDVTNIYVIYSSNPVLSVKVATSYSNSTDINLSMSGATKVVSDYTYFYCSASSSSMKLNITTSNNSYNYFIEVGSTPTTSSDVNSSIYNWVPNSNILITVYVYQRYTITYNGNGNTGGVVPSNTYKVHGKSATLTNNTLTKTGYTADGWYTNSTGTGGSKYTTSYASNKDINLYANWKANEYTVNYNSSGGTLNNYNYAIRLSDYSTTSNGVTISYNATTGVTTLNGTMTANIVVTRYASSFSAGTYQIGYQVLSGSMTRKAGNVTYEFNNSSWGSLSSRKSAGFFNANNTNSGTLSLTSDVLDEAKGFQVWFWYDSSNGGGYTFKNLQIRFWCYLSTPSVTQQSITYGTQVAMPYATRTGYVFTNWNSKVDGTGTTYGPDNVGSMNLEDGASITLYAQWQAKTYVLT